MTHARIFHPPVPASACSPTAYKLPICARQGLAIAQFQRYSSCLEMHPDHIQAGLLQQSLK